MVGGEGGVYPHPHIPYTSTQRYKGLTPTSTYFFFGGWGAVHTNYLGWRSGRVDPTGFGGSAVIQRPARTREAPSPPTPLSPVPPIANRRPHRAPQIIHRSTEGYGGGAMRGALLCPGGAHGGLRVCMGGQGEQPHTHSCATHACVCSPEPLRPRDGRSPAHPPWGEALWDLSLFGVGVVFVCVCMGWGGGREIKPKRCFKNGSQASTPGRLGSSERM